MKFKPSLLLSALLLAGTLCESNRAQPSTRLMRNGPSPLAFSIKENFLTVERLRVRYIESGSGPAVVMIHGNAGSIEDFEFGVIQALSLNYRVLAVDRPGHGKSERPKAGTVRVEDQARLLHEVLVSLGVTQPVLIG